MPERSMVPRWEHLGQWWSPSVRRPYFAGVENQWPNDRLHAWIAQLFPRRPVRTISPGRAAGTSHPEEDPSPLLAAGVSEKEVFESHRETVDLQNLPSTPTHRRHRTKEEHLAEGGAGSEKHSRVDREQGGWSPIRLVQGKRLITNERTEAKEIQEPETSPLLTQPWREEDRVDAASRSRMEKLFPIVHLADALSRELQPSNDRRWEKDQAILATAEIGQRKVLVHNIRHCRYRSVTDYTVRYYDAVYPIEAIESIDLIVIPFASAPSLAHLEMSFGFDDGRYLGISIEARYEKGESYDPISGLLRQFELIYVVADERDLIRLCTDHCLSSVYMYRLRFTPEESRRVFLDVMKRLNQLVHQPEFYHTLRNNCTTNLIDHLHHGRPGAIPYGYHTIFPGLLDELLFERNLIKTDATSFQQLRRESRVNKRAYLFGEREDFSLKIRLPEPEGASRRF